MLTYPEIDPVIFSLGPLKVHWYGMMYLLGIVGAWLLAMRRCTLPHSPIAKDQLEDLVMYVALGVVLGGRIGYGLFYGQHEWQENPFWLFRLWEGGMSFHGGLLGVMLAVWLYSRKVHRGFVVLMDFIAPLVPIGLGLGRLGNFINQELWGRATSSQWGMVFPNDPFGLARHPSQLYQFALEGVLLFILLYTYSAKPRPRYAVSGMFLVLYGCFRFLVEFFREPDAHIGFDLFDWVTRGQLLSAPMVVIGVLLVLVAYHKDHPIHQEAQSPPSSSKDKKA